MKQIIVKLRDNTEIEMQQTYEYASSVKDRLIELCQDCRQEILDWIELALDRRLEEQLENERRERNLQ